MPIVYIAAYCLVVVVLLFGLTFRQEWRDEKRMAKRRKKFVVIDGGKSRRTKLHRSA